MSKNRQIELEAAPVLEVGDDLDPGRAIRCLSRDYPAGHRLARHSHARAQLLHAARGIMQAATEEGTWLVPPDQAVWIPSGVAHGVESLTPLSMRSVYVHPDLVGALPAETQVVAVSDLLRALILKAAAHDGAAMTEEIARLHQVMLDELAELQPAPLHMPEPVDPRARRVAQALRRNPGDPRSLVVIARQAGASARTLTRLFHKETGMTFRAWRARLTLTEAVKGLAEGEGVVALAARLGYESPSAFVVMFRRALGTTPGRYIKGQKD